MKIVQIPVLRDNYTYLLICEKTNQGAVVDPAEAAPVIKVIEREKVEPVAIFNTHHHADHVGGNRGLLERYKLQVYAHRSDKGRIPGLTRELEEGDEVTLGELRARVIFVPGHTSGHIAYLFPGHLFCGDTLFVAGCGRLFEGSAEQMQGSLSKLRDLPPDTRIYCAHEYTVNNLKFAVTVEANNKKLTEKLKKANTLREKGLSTVPSTMEEERETNPFLRWESQEIQQNLKKQFPNLHLDPVSVFAQVRQLKDAF